MAGHLYAGTYAEHGPKKIQSPCISIVVNFQFHLVGNINFGIENISIQNVTDALINP